MCDQSHDVQDHLKPADYDRRWQRLGCPANELPSAICARTQLRCPVAETISQLAEQTNQGCNNRQEFARAVLSTHQPTGCTVLYGAQTL